MLATKFIIALCPATPTYLHADTANPTKTEGVYATSHKAAARVFDTFEAAMEVAQDITGWGGAQRVEQIAVQVPDPQSLATEDDLNEIRDLCTSEWCEAVEASTDVGWESVRTTVTRAAKYIEKALRDRGLKVAVENRGTEDDATSPSNPITVDIADHLGNTLQLDWDPMQDGFDISEATCLAEPDHGCAGNCKPLSRKAARALRKWGNEKCQRAWHLNRLRGEGLTVCSIETGIPVRSVNSAINAWQEVWAQNFERDCAGNEPTCDACGADGAEPCGDTDKDSPFVIMPILDRIEATLCRDDLTFDQTPLTDKQRAHARRVLSDLLNTMIDTNIARLASIALEEGRAS